MTSQELLWPNLGFVNIGELEYPIPEYYSSWFIRMAEHVEAGHRGGSKSRLLAEGLRQIAVTPGAIRELNEYRQLTPGPILGLNWALHYLVRLSIRGGERKKEAVDDVARAWSAPGRPVKAGTIRRATDKHGKKAKQLLDVHVELCQKREPKPTFAEIIKWFDADLHLHARRMRKPAKSAVKSKKSKRGKNRP